MPLYEYKCDGCGTKFDKLGLFRDRIEIEPCPLCGKPGFIVISIVHDSFGWMLDDQSHIKGHKDNWIRAV